MAAKSKNTYLIFHGGTTEQHLEEPQGGSGFGPSADGNIVVTVWARLLEWPTTTQVIFRRKGVFTHPSSGGDFGLYYVCDQWNRDTFDGRENAGDDLCMGFVYSTTSGIRHAIVPGTTTGVPIKLGTLHKFTYVVHVEPGSPDVCHAALFVDGVSVFQATLGTAIAPLGSPGDKFQIGGHDDSDFAFGDDSDPPQEPTPWEIYQFMAEEDRTNITVTDGDIDMPSGTGSDPWEVLEVDASADTGSFAVAFDEGTGTRIDTTDSNWKWTATGSVAWADEDLVDPQITAPTASTGRAVYSFDNTKDYEILGSDSADAALFPVFWPTEGSGAISTELRLRPTPTIWNEHGHMRDSDTAPPFETGEWQPAGLGLAKTTDQIAYGGIGSIKSGMSGGTQHGKGNPQAHTGSKGAGSGQWSRALFWDKGGTHANTRHGYTVRSAAIEQEMKYQTSRSSTEYYIRVDDTDGNQTTGEARVEDQWNEFMIYQEEGGGSNDTRRFYLNGEEVYEVTTNASTIGSIPGVSSRGFSEDERFMWDYLAFNSKFSDTPADFEGLVAPEYLIELPPLSFGGASSFDDVTLTDATTGTNSMEVGTLLYEFRHKKDGGAFGSWTTLNDSNWTAITPGTTTNDVELRVTLTPGMDDMSSPAVRTITLDWTAPNWTLLFMQRSFDKSCSGGF